MELSEKLQVQLAYSFTIIADMESTTQNQNLSGKQENIERFDLFQFTRRTMYITVMVPLNLDRILPKRLRFLVTPIELFYELFTLFCAIHIWVLYVCTVYLFFNESNLEFIVDCLLQTLLYAWAIFMKIYFRRIRVGLGQELMETLNAEYQTRSAKGLTYVTMQGSLAKSNLYLKIFVYSSLIATSFWMMLPIANGGRVLPLQCWYPVDYKKPILYEMLYFFQFVGQIQVGAAFAISSGYHMNLAIIISGQYDTLFCSLKNLVATTYIHMGKPIEDLMKLKRDQEIADDEPDQYYCVTESHFSLEELQQFLSIARPKSGDFLTAFKKAFRNCVMHHRFILKMVNKMESFFSIIWFLKCGEVILALCLVAFVQVKSTTSFVKTLSLAQYLSLVILEMLIISYFGQIIFLNSARCDEAILRSPWYLHLREMKNDFLLFLINSRRPFKLTAGKISTLNIEQFRTIMTTAFSFLTLLQKMDNRN